MASTSASSGSSSSNEEIISVVDALQPEAIRILSEMVRFDSLLNNEHSVQDYCAKLLANYLGFEIDRFQVDLEHLKTVKGFSPVNWKYDSNKQNVIGIHKSKTKKGRSLIFNGHIDVVPVEGGVDQWTAPPFEPVVRDGRLYGRGSGDMKAGIVCFVTALKALEKLGWKPAADVYLQTVVEEECTGNGTLACLAQRNYRADLVLIPEPFPFLVTAQMGVMWFHVKVRGKPVHAMEAGAGINAIDAAYHLYQELRKVEERWNEPDRRHPMYKHMKHPVNFNFGVIKGGDWPSSVPSACHFDVRVGFFPGVTLESVKSEIEAALVRASQSHPAKIHYEISYNGFQAEGCVMDYNSAGLKQLQATHKAVTHRDVVLEPVTCTTDARHFQLYHNIPTTCYGPEAKSIHGIDESVSIASMMEVARVFAVFIRDWCGLEQA